MKIKKAVFPLAGLGSRMLPITKVIEKEMLPVANKPIIQYAVEEALASGITDFIFIVRNKKNIIKKYFEPDSFNTEMKELTCVKKLNSLISKMGVIKYVQQKKPLGLGDAIWCAKDVIGRKPFAVLLADNLIRSKIPIISQMIRHFGKLNSSIVAVSKIKHLDTNKYGILKARQPNSNGLTRIYSLHEKPSPANAPSNLGVIGRYILKPDIFNSLEKNKAGYGGEFQLTDAISDLAKKQPVYGYYSQYTCFDCGSIDGLQMANIAFSMKKSKVKDKLISFDNKIL